MGGLLNLGVGAAPPANEEDDDANEGTQQDDARDDDHDNVPCHVKEAGLIGIPSAHEDAQRDRLLGGAEVAADKGQAVAENI